MAMNVVARTRLAAFWAAHRAAEGPLTKWHTAASHASWSCFDDVRKTYNSADAVKGLVVFNVNSYRVIVDIFYAGRQVYIKHVFTHTEYERWTASLRST